jgi:hypothetical protein
MKTYPRAPKLLEQELLPYEYQFVNENYKEDTTMPSNFL